MIIDIEIVNLIKLVIAFGLLLWLWIWTLG